MNLKSIENVSVLGKRVIVRVDWNVTLGKAMQVVDDTRIVRTIPTIQLLLKNGAKKIILLSHLGSAEERKSLLSVVEKARILLGEEIVLCSSIAECQREGGRVVMLENIRLWEGEVNNSERFASELASLGEIYVNEAFGESHRSVASIVGIPKFLPSYAGLWLVDEVENILKVRESPQRPMVLIMGGAKVDDKIKLLELFARHADTILLGGKLANEYVERGYALNDGARVILPKEGSKIKDIGEETCKLFEAEIKKAKTIVWNGPMGMVEEEQYRAGTDAIFEAICDNEEAYTLVGGGDTLAAVGSEAHIERIDHVSTGGGAMLKLLESGTLVGIEMLKS